jgi:hypothetical protein
MQKLDFASRNGGKQALIGGFTPPRPIGSLFLGRFCSIIRSVGIGHGTRSLQSSKIRSGHVKFGRHSQTLARNVSARITSSGSKLDVWSFCGNPFPRPPSLGKNMLLHRTRKPVDTPLCPDITPSQKPSRKRQEPNQDPRDPDIEGGSLKRHREPRFLLTEPLSTNLARDATRQ